MPYFEIIIFLCIIVSVFSFFSLAPWFPTDTKDIERIFDVIKLKKGEHLLEMGCGTASVSLALARHHPDAHIVGIELSPFFYLISKIRGKISGLENIEILYGNALHLDLSVFDVIYVFGMPKTVTEKLFPKISQVKNQNFRCISYCFKMTNDFFEETKHKIEKRNSIYEYRLKKF